MLSNNSLSFVLVLKRGLGGLSKLWVKCFLLERERALFRPQMIERLPFCPASMPNKSPELQYV